MSDYHDALLEDYRHAYAVLFARSLQLEVENRQLRRANAILALPRITDTQVVETEAALRRLVDLDEVTK